MKPATPPRSPPEKHRPDPAKQIEKVPEAAEYRSDWNNDATPHVPKPTPSTKEQPV